MSDHGHDDGNEGGHDGETHADAEHGADVDDLERVTSPMQSFGMREVGIGVLVFVVGAIITFGLPLALA